MSKKEKIFKSIYENAEGYRKLTYKLISRTDSQFADEMISECVIKLLDKIDSGKIKVNDICYKQTDGINHSFFATMLRRKIIDTLRKEKVKFVYEYELTADEPVLINDLDETDELEYIRERIKQHSKSEWFESKIFEIIFFQGVSARELSKRSGISRHVIGKVRASMMLKVKEFKSDFKNQQMKTSKAVIGTNVETKERRVFSSISKAKRNGFHIDRALKSGSEYKGYTWEFVNDLESDEIQEAINRPSQGLGDVVAKVLHSPIMEPITNAVKSIMWDKDGNCGCEDRLKKLNDLIPFGRKKPKRFLTRTEFEQFNELKDSKRLTNEQQRFVSKIHAEVFGHQFFVPCSCSPRVMRGWIEHIKNLNNSMLD